MIEVPYPLSRVALPRFADGVACAAHQLLIHGHYQATADRRVTPPLWCHMILTQVVRTPHPALLILTDRWFGKSALAGARVEIYGWDAILVFQTAYDCETPVVVAWTAPILGKAIIWAAIQNMLACSDNALEQIATLVDAGVAHTPAGVSRE